MSRPSAVRRPAAYHAPLTRLIALVVMLGQLLVASAAWADAATEGVADARPHVEQDGTQLHHAHVESQCALCAAQHLLVGAVSPSPRPGPVRRPAHVRTTLAAVAP